MGTNLNCYSYANLRNCSMPKLSSRLNTYYLAAAHAQGWRRDRIKHRKFLFEWLLKLAKGSHILEMSAREIAQYTDLSQRSVQAGLVDLEVIGMLQHFPPLKDPQYQLPNRYVLQDGSAPIENPQQPEV